jgi:hypothetical protein
MVTITHDSPLTKYMEAALCYMSIETPERLGYGHGSLYPHGEPVAMGLVRRGCITPCRVEVDGRPLESWTLTAHGERIAAALWAQRTLRVVR